VSKNFKVDLTLSIGNRSFKFPMGDCPDQKPQQLNSDLLCKECI